MNKKGKKSFTLAEIILVVAALGIVAVITISTLINKNIETQKRTKLKKAMATYDKLLSRLSAEGEIKSNEDLKDLKDNCGKTSQYFKIAKTDDDDSNDCIFKTTDGVWWNVSNMQKPMIAFEESDIKAENADAKALDLNDYSTFYFVAHFDNDGILRIDDNAYEIKMGTKSDIANSNKITQKLYRFMANAKSVGNDVSTYVPPAQNAQFLKFKNGDFDQACTDDIKVACTQRGDWPQIYEYETCAEYDENWECIGDERVTYQEADYSGYNIYTYDENGNVIYKDEYSCGWDCYSTSCNCEYSSGYLTLYDDQGRVYADAYGCSGKDLTGCTYRMSTYDEQGRITEFKYMCNDLANPTSCSVRTNEYIEDEHGNTILNNSKTCNLQGTGCSYNRVAYIPGRTDELDGNWDLYIYNCDSSYNCSSCQENVNDHSGNALRCSDYGYTCTAHTCWND